MNVFAKFDEIPSMILEVIKETKRFGHTVGRSDGLSDNIETVYPPTNTVCGGITIMNALVKTIPVTRRGFLKCKGTYFLTSVGIMLTL